MTPMCYPTVLIVGAGPAGIAAAIQLRRYGLELILLECQRVGGLLWNANLVENYPGFPAGVTGPKLAALFERQLRRAGVKIVCAEVTRLDYDNGWRVQTAQTGYSPDVVVIASGTQPRPYPLAIPPEAQGHVFSEVWPLLDVRGKEAVIVGAGDAAFDYALNLAGRDNRVTILNRGNETKCLPLLRQRAAAHPLITYRGQTQTQRLEYDPAADRLVLITDHCSLSADYLLFAIGREPRLDFLSESVKSQATNFVQNGKLYLIGDVHNGLFRQTAIAVGEGLRAAMQIYARGALER